MYITKIESLGTDYTVADSDGNIIKTIQVIPHNEILNAACGVWDWVEPLDMYIEKSVSCLSGYDEVSPLRVLWYSSVEDEVVLSELIEYAVHHGYDKIILEHLDTDEACMLN